VESNLRHLGILNRRSLCCISRCLVSLFDTVKLPLEVYGNREVNARTAAVLLQNKSKFA
jgi:hypothetical protein